MFGVRKIGKFREDVGRVVGREVGSWEVRMLRGKCFKEEVFFFISCYS